MVLVLVLESMSKTIFSCLDLDSNEPVSTATMGEVHLVLQNHCPVGNAEIKLDKFWLVTVSLLEASNYLPCSPQVPRDPADLRKEHLFVSWL